MKNKQLKEDAPLNSVGNGMGVQGIGVGPNGEPGGPKSKLIKRILKRRQDKDYKHVTDY
jgi:hypothetical protein